MKKISDMQKFHNKASFTSFVRWGLLVFILHFSFHLALSAQTVQQMKKDRARLEQQIKESQKLLASTGKDVKSQLAQLSVLSERIRQQTELVTQLDNELKATDAEITRLGSELKELEAELQMRKKRYASALGQSVHRNSFENRMLFLLSSDTFRQMYRRMRYLGEYAHFQAQQGREIQAKQQELETKREELESLKTSQTELLAQQKAEQQALASQKAEQQTLVSRLQKKQADIKSEIKRQQSEYDRLDKKIEQLINEQIAASQAKSKGKTSTPKGKDTTKKTETTGSGTGGGFKMSADDVKLSGSFLSNKGRLPVPVQGSYMIAAHYGIHQMPNMKYVTVNNQGVDLRCGAGATARNIFDGEVSAIFEHPSRKTYGVLVRHGDYISVYCNLATLSVRQGDKIKGGTAIGTIHTDPSGESILQFQLRKELQRLNPEEWIKF